MREKVDFIGTLIRVLIPKVGFLVEGPFLKNSMSSLVEVLFLRD